jgi:DNA-binding response OmpR family regulator
VTQPAQVVVADDDDDIRELVHLKLSQAGHDVHTCSDGMQALEHIRRNPPQLAVLDVMMPGLSGIDVLREIRADDALTDVRVMLLTARSRDNDVDLGFATGADDYLIKPFSPRELAHRVAALLGRGR